LCLDFSNCPKVYSANSPSHTTTFMDNIFILLVKGINREESKLASLGPMIPRPSLFCCQVTCCTGHIHLGSSNPPLPTPTYQLSSSPYNLHPFFSLKIVRNYAGKKMAPGPQFPWQNPYGITVSALSLASFQIHWLFYCRRHYGLSLHLKSKVLSETTLQIFLFSKMFTIP
jgi:hypothetical protein